jgi:AcrR family transcriptional regulator
MTNKATRPRKRDGTLRDGLIEVGITLLREKGPDGLSLRECAARAGVSHAAPTYHFKNLKGLSTAIAARAFSLFAQSMETSIADAADTPSARLAAICEGYLAFAKAHRELFLFMFSGLDLNGDDPEFEAASTRAYTILSEVSAPFVGPGDDPEEIELLIWSVAHGYSHLAMINKKRPRSKGNDLPTLANILRHLDIKPSETGSDQT